MRRTLIGLAAAAAMALAPVIGYAQDDQGNSDHHHRGGACTDVFQCPGTDFGTIFAGIGVAGLTALAILLATSGGHNRGPSSTTSTTATATH